MRLCHIINEDIKKTTFFDFYTMLVAYQEGIVPAENRQLIERQLTLVCQEILNDHLNQFCDMVINRISDTEQQLVLDAMKKFRLTEKDYIIQGLDKLSLNDKINYIRTIKDYEPFGFTGDTWRGLANWIISLKIPRDLNGMILAIDKIYGMLHHGGQITDYMDEADWMESALNYRDSANLAQLARYASPQTRELIGRSSLIGLNRQEVTDIQKLKVACDRLVSARMPFVHAEMIDNKLTIAGKAYTLIDKQNGKVLPWKNFGNGTERFKKFTKTGMVEIGPIIEFSATVADNGNELIITSNNSTVSVPKPINRYFNLAYDIIYASEHSAELNRPLSHGIGIVQIKDSYYRINKRPPK